MRRSPQWLPLAALALVGCANRSGNGSPSTSRTDAVAWSERADAPAATPPADTGADLPARVAGDAPFDLDRAPAAWVPCDGQGKCPAGKVCKTAECYGDNGRSCADLIPSCPEGSPPRCGCDLVTYPNICALIAAGTAVISEGACWAAPVRPDAGGYYDKLLLLPLTWGGKGVQMDVGATGVTFKLPCGSGEYRGPPLLTNYEQRLFGWGAEFSWEGTYRRNGTTAYSPARFHGSLSLSPREGMSLQVSTEPGVYHALQPRTAATASACAAP